MALDITFRKSDINFLSIIRTRVNAYFTEQKIKSTGNQAIINKSIVILIGFVASFLFPLLVHPLPTYILVLNYAFLGIMLSLIGFNIMHDGSHDSFSSKKSINKLTAYSLNFLGGNASFWRQKHCVNHHTFTNIEEVDDDIDLKPFLRLHAEQKHKWYHRYQHYYAFVLYCLTFIFWIHYRDYKKYFNRKIAEETPMQPLDTADHFIFWFSKILHITVFLVIPSLIIGPKIAILGYILASVFCGFTLAIVFQLAHIVEGTVFEAPEVETKKVNIETEWSIYQINTTVNFATNNKILTWLLGGLNFQMVHHLFPRISHVHYPAIHSIITEACKEYQIAYVEYDNLGTAIGSHLRQLQKMGVA